MIYIFAKLFFLRATVKLLYMKNIKANFQVCISEILILLDNLKKRSKVLLTQKVSKIRP